jgi:hypothetical protein
MYLPLDNDLTRFPLPRLMGLYLVIWTTDSARRTRRLAPARLSVGAEVFRLGGNLRKELL